MNRVIALIPAYCPGTELLDLTDELNLQGCICLIVDDGSPKKYEVIFEEAAKDSIVLHHEKNEGKGAALKTGLKYIQETFGGCVVVTVDADGQHLPEDVMNCARAAGARNNTLILGTRTFEKKEVPFKSYYGNKITETVFRLFTHEKVHDTQTGLRAFSSRMIPEFLEVEGSRYEYEMNQLLYCAKEQIRFCEVPIRTVYQNDNAGSHFHPVRDAFLIYKKLLKFALSSFSGFLVDYVLFGLLSVLFTGAYGLVLSNVCARVVSAVFNYEVNRRIVFKDNTGRFKSFSKYALLAAGILVCNTAILYGLTQVIGIPAMLAKIMTEGILFLASWTIQNRLIFHGRSGRAIA